MGEPKAITYKQVEKAVGEGSRAVWEKIGKIAETGDVPLDPDGNASIDLTDVSDSKRARIDALLAPETAKEDEVAIQEPAAKGGKK